MLFRQIIHEDLGCASYLVADRESGVAVVVDPQWEVEPYRRLARLHGADGAARRLARPGRRCATTPKRQFRGRRPAAPVPCHTDAGYRRTAVGGTPSRLGKILAGDPRRGVKGLRKLVIGLRDGHPMRLRSE